MLLQPTWDRFRVLLWWNMLDLPENHLEAIVTVGVVVSVIFSLICAIAMYVAYFKYKNSIFKSENKEFVLGNFYF